MKSVGLREITIIGLEIYNMHFQSIFQLLNLLFRLNL